MLFFKSDQRLGGLQLLPGAKPLLGSAIHCERLLVQVKGPFKQKMPRSGKHSLLHEQQQRHHRLPSRSSSAQGLPQQGSDRRAARHPKVHGCTVLDVQPLICCNAANQPAPQRLQIFLWRFQHAFQATQRLSERSRRGTLSANLNDCFKGHLGGRSNWAQIRNPNVLLIHEVVLLQSQMAHQSLPKVSYHIILLRWLFIQESPGHKSEVRGHQSEIEDILSRLTTFGNKFTDSSRFQTEAMRFGPR
mmetsp:Transcript_90334/g.241979  ORF Transcript_90334/g.241979 Transcript_90334/m.241979 type:complete len:246 (-) Transcript_90334:250-987(-)